MLLTARDWLLVPFSLLWAGFAIFWESSVVGSNGPFFMKLWGIPFVLIGLYFVAGRFVFDAWVRRGMVYAVTDKRVLILRSGPLSKFSALDLEQLPDANLSESANGRGTIRFGGAAPALSGRSFSSWTPSLDPTPQFIEIEDVSSVFNYIQSAITKRTR